MGDEGSGTLDLSHVYVKNGLARVAQSLELFNSILSQSPSRVDVPLGYYLKLRIGRCRLLLPRRRVLREIIAHRRRVFLNGRILI